MDVNKKRQTDILFESVIEAIDSLGGEATALQIANAIGKPRKNVSMYLASLRKQELITVDRYDDEISSYGRPSRVAVFVRYKGPESDPTEAEIKRLAEECYQKRKYVSEEDKPIPAFVHGVSFDQSYGCFNPAIPLAGGTIPTIEELDRRAMERKKRENGNRGLPDNAQRKRVRSSNTVDDASRQGVDKHA